MKLIHFGSFTLYRKHAQQKPSFIRALLAKVVRHG